jgi:hypothetical protein
MWPKLDQVSQENGEKKLEGALAKLKNLSMCTCKLAKFAKLTMCTYKLGNLTMCKLAKLDNLAT